MLVPLRLCLIIAPHWQPYAVTLKLALEVETYSSCMLHPLIMAFEELCLHVRAQVVRRLQVRTALTCTSMLTSLHNRLESDG